MSIIPFILLVFYASKCYYKNKIDDVYRAVKTIKGVMKMELKKAAMAGTVESSDAQVSVEPATSGIELNIESSVIHQYGKQIKAVVLETLDRLGVKNAKVTIVDKGALDCTLKARVEGAVFRAMDNGQDAASDWGGVIR